MRKLVLAGLLTLGLSNNAHAEAIGIGGFLGEPTGLDIKLDLQRRSALDIVLGVTTFRDGHVSYGHLTYLYTLGVAHGQSARIPFRIGLGGALFGVTESSTGLAARVPFEMAIRFRRSPLEIYGEVTFVLQLIDTVEPNVDGGIGLRVYF